jgi:hypothetical protein
MIGSVFALILISERTRHSHKMVMQSALLSGMQRTYDKVKAKTTASSFEVTPEAMQRLLIGDDGRLTQLPSFLIKSNVYLPKKPVTISSDDLLLIVRFGGKWYAIDCSGRQKQVSKAPASNLFLPLSY